MSTPFRWSSSEAAAHVFLLASKIIWIQWGLGRWVTDMDDTVGISKVMNGDGRYGSSGVLVL
jgi:hypothetical protein